MDPKEPPNPDEDVLLLTAWQRGEAHAGRELYTRHAQAVKHYFRRRIAVTHEVAELVQETFLRCQVVAYRGGGSVRALLLGIAFRAYLEHIRKIQRRRHRETHDDALLEMSAADFESDPEYVLTQKQTTRLLMKAMRRIPQKYQMVLEMSHWEGLTQSEISEVVGRPASTIGRMKSEAFAALERTMSVLAESPELLERTTMTITAWRTSLRRPDGEPAPNCPEA